MTDEWEGWWAWRKVKTRGLLDGSVENGSD